MTSSPAVSAPATTQPGLLLRLAGPMQSWGERSHFNDRDTAAFPTLSGVVGLLAGALGRARGESIEDLAQLSLTVRVDRPGVLLRDLHTVGGGLPATSTVTTAEGKKRSGSTTTLLSHRTYLADAVFTCAVTGRAGDEADARLLEACATALRRPRWPLYLGRRSCPPEGPLLLGRTSQALTHLVALPIAAPRPDHGGDDSATTPVTFLSSAPLDGLRLPDGGTEQEDDGLPATSTVNDRPLSFGQTQRSYRSRPLYRRTLPLPARQFEDGLGAAHLHALSTYLHENQNTIQE
ncbi:type I-E CRISPR-associated protein Cas5/CasD [Streptomyces sp. NPDC089919]|uniref:type I-E CRISPR-associated protein Cas5/CasD n=1 Tax=Streptomyces sp. NPDC089919 TaxID=3155188 RepID=UPI003448B601